MTATRRRRSLHYKSWAPPGTAPGTLRVNPNAVQSEISAIGYGPKVIESLEINSASELPALQERFPVLWVNINGLGDTELIQEIGDVFHLHSLALADAVNVHQRPKADVYENHLFVVVRMINCGDAYKDSEQVSLFLGDGFVISFQERPGDCFAPVRERLQLKGGRLRNHQADYLSYALIDAVVDAYFPLLEQYGEELEELESRVVDYPEEAMISEIHNMKRELLSVRRSVWPLREMVNSLIRDESPYISDAVRPFLRDVYDHAIQLMDMVESYREVASGLLDVYLTSVGNRMNEIMKVLTIIATIFIPLSFVVGLYGMNFDTSSPYNMPELGWRYGYLTILSLMIGIVGGFLFYFRHRGWIGQTRRRKKRYLARITQSLKDGRR